MTAENAPPLAIALTCPAWPPDRVASGVVSYVADMAAGLRNLGHRPTILAQSIRGDAGGGDPRDAPIDLGPMAGARGVAGRLGDRLLGRLDPQMRLDRSVCRGVVLGARRAVAERGAQLLEMEEAFGWPRRVAPRLGVPLVVRLHGPWFVNGPLRGAAEDAAFRRRVGRERAAILAADAISSPSREVLDRTRAYYGLPLDGAEVVANPGPVVPPERRWRLDACDPATILFVGRFDRHKGGDVLIDAFARVAARRPEARLRFVGPDPGLADDAGRAWTLPDYIKEHAGEALAAGRIDWRGQRPRAEAAELRLRSMVTVIASRYETFGITVAEAMAQGCPLVATRAGAIPEIVDDGRTGLLCRPGDPGALAAAIERLLDSPGLAARLGAEAAEEAARNYHPDTLARRMAGFYRRVLERARPRGG